MRNKWYRVHFFNTENKWHSLAKPVLLNSLGFQYRVIVPNLSIVKVLALCLGTAWSLVDLVRTS